MTSRFNLEYDYVSIMAVRSPFVFGVFAKPLYATNCKRERRKRYDLNRLPLPWHIFNSRAKLYVRGVDTGRYVLTGDTS